jgi:hypothetical protein
VNARILDVKGFPFLRNKAVASLPSEAWSSLISISTDHESLTMEVMPHQNTCTIEDVIKTTDGTLKECKGASQRLDPAANVWLRPLGRNLGQIKVYLGMIEDDKEVLDRLDVMEIGGEAAPFLNALDRDMSVICTYLQNATSPLKEAEVEAYAQALDGYAVVLNVVLSRSKK